MKSIFLTYLFVFMFVSGQCLSAPVDIVNVSLKDTQIKVQVEVKDRVATLFFETEEIFENGCDLVVSAIVITHPAKSNPGRIYLKIKEGKYSNSCNNKNGPHRFSTKFLMGNVLPSLKAGKYFVIINKIYFKLVVIGKSKRIGNETNNGYVLDSVIWAPADIQIPFFPIQDYFESDLSFMGNSLQLNE